MPGRRSVVQRFGPGLRALLLFVSFAPPASGQVVFPLKLSADGRHLQDSVGQPFTIQASSAWSLITQLSLQDIELFLEDRRDRGFNTVIVTLITHKFTDGAPRNAAGVAPFASVESFSAPNQEYFDHVDRALDVALRKGFLVFVAPAYFGYGGGDEGWFQEIANTDTSLMNDYGRYVGSRYRTYPNVAWLLGGDFSPPPGSRGEANAVEMANGIRATDRPDRLYSYHGGRGTTSFEHVAFRSFVNVNAVYTGPIDVYQLCHRAHDEATLPTFLIEAWYENEHRMTRLDVRKQAYWATTYCTAGQTLGNAPMWNFGAAAAVAFADNRSLTWQAAMNWPASRDQALLFDLIAGVGAYGLIPDRGANVVTSGAGTFGGDEYATTAIKPDRSASLSYLPVISTLTVNLEWFRGPVTLRWFDPTSGSLRSAGRASLPNVGSMRVTPPGRNASGATDWVLVGTTRGPE